MVEAAALAVPEHARELEEARDAGDEQLLHREFGTGVEMPHRAPLARLDELGRERDEMRLQPRAHLERGRLDLDEAALGEKPPHGRRDARAHLERRAPLGQTLRVPPAHPPLFRPRA
jgi:hypothetical protein